VRLQLACPLPCPFPLATCSRWPHAPGSRCSLAPPPLLPLAPRPWFPVPPDPPPARVDSPAFRAQFALVVADERHRCGAQAYR
jgi:hypothetical protein